MSGKRTEFTILIVTVTDEEFSAVCAAFGRSQPSLQAQPMGNVTYFDLGAVGGCRVYLVTCEPGSGTPGGSLQTVAEAIDHLMPKAVISCGIAFGVQRPSHKEQWNIGDILVSRQLHCYEPSREGEEQDTKIPRGDRVTCHSWLLSRLRGAASQRPEPEPPVHFGLMVSGEKLVDSREFLNGIRAEEPEAIGGDMEGAGLYAAAKDRHVDWVIVKAISDWGDGTKAQTERKQTAARNSAEFVHHAISEGLLADEGTGDDVFSTPAAHAGAIDVRQLGYRRTTTGKGPPGPPTGSPWYSLGNHPGHMTAGPDGSPLVWVPSGEFIMGETWRDALGKTNTPHVVHITRGFWIGKCQVTNKQYADFLNVLKSEVDSEGHLLFDIDSADSEIEFVEYNRVQPKPGRDEHPVVSVSWYGAKAYAEHYHMRLLTEAEWEYAARGPRSWWYRRGYKRYPWGNRWDPRKCCNQDNLGANGRTFPVGSFPKGASWCGALNMVGNVWECCEDWYDEHYYGMSPRVDPPGPDASLLIVVRGGSWFYDQYWCTTTHRHGTETYHTNNSLGFRCAYTPSRPASPWD